MADPITCGCGARLAVDNVPEGSSIRCPKCGEVCSTSAPATRPCPYCAETIPADAPACPLCGTAFQEEQAEGNCPRCGAQMLPGHAFCVHCQSEGEGTQPSPWDRRHEIGTIQAIKETTKGVMLHPGQFFKSIHPTGNHGSTLGYGALLGSVYGMAAQLIGLGINFAVMRPLQKMEENPIGLGTDAGVTLLFTLFLPLFVTIGLYISSGLIHLGLLLCGGNRNGFEATFRTVSYCQSVQIVSLIPFVGPSVAGIWMIVAQIMGIMGMHRTSGGKAAFSVLWVLLLACGCGIILVIGIKAMVADGFGRAL